MADETPRPMPTITISATFDGFPFTIAVQGKTDVIPDLIQRLQDIGATPPAVVAAGSTNGNASGGVPSCQYHGPMKESQHRPGTYYCSKKMGDGSYCKEKA